MRLLIQFKLQRYNFFLIEANFECRFLRIAKFFAKKFTYCKVFVPKRRMGVKIDRGRKIDIPLTARGIFVHR